MLCVCITLVADTYTTAKFVVDFATIVQPPLLNLHQMINRPMLHFQWYLEQFSFSDFPLSFLCCIPSKHQNYIPVHRCHPIRKKERKNRAIYWRTQKLNGYLDFYLHRFPFLLEFLLLVSSTSSEDITCVCVCFPRMKKKLSKNYLVVENGTRIHTTLSCIRSHTQREVWQSNCNTTNSTHFCLLSVGLIQLQVLFFPLFSFHFFIGQRHCSLTLDVLCWKWIYCSPKLCSAAVLPDAPHHPNICCCEHTHRRMEILTFQISVRSSFGWQRYQQNCT